MLINTPENIKILRKKIGLTQKECAEMFGMTARSWRRKEEPQTTASNTTLSPIEFNYLLLLAGEHPDYVLCKREALHPLFADAHTRSTAPRPTCSRTA
ncbi:helix-turn-helix domain-containing protein [Enterobacter hormaechei]|nr:XRE family transcriptional regulator [Enterobacter hormaechei]MDF3630344.1 XRE family transcriptional regulator [Enterobacter hormaechei]MDF3659906.1 XRE family transcriptional regulator [Enterobacter hormaechei]